MATRERLQNATGRIVSVDMKRDTRVELMAAAWMCFRHLGARETSADDIAVRAGISRSSFYRYFKGMDELIASMATDIGIANLRSALANAEVEGGRGVDWSEFVCHAVWGILHDPQHALIASSGADNVHTIYHSRIGGHFLDLLGVLLPNIEADRKRGMLRDDLTAEGLAEWFLRQIWCLSSAPPPGGWSHAELLAYVRAFISPGIAPPNEPPRESALLTEEVGRLKQALGFIESYISKIPDLKAN